jgi:hypothetical protein
MIQRSESAPEPANPDQTESSPEQIYFRGDMATEMYVTYPDKTAWVVTKADLQNFAPKVNATSRATSRLFNGICAELSLYHKLPHLNKDDFLVCGLLVQRPLDHSKHPAKEYGLRVDSLKLLEAELTTSPEPIDGYGKGSQEFLQRFVAELFQPPEA